MLEDLVEADETVTAHKKRRLKSLCHQMVERHHSIAILVELFPFVINMISMLDDEGDDRVVALLGAISRTNFVCALAVANEILAITLQASNVQQSGTQHLGDACDRVRVLNQKFNDLRDRSDEPLECVHHQAVVFGTALGLDTAVPRGSGSHEDVKSHLRKAFLLPFLAALTEKLNLLFSRDKPEVLALQELIPKFTRVDSADKIVPLLHLRV